MATKSSLQELINVKRSIRDKVLAIKLGESENETKFQKTFKPLIEPLNELVTQTVDDNYLEPIKTTSTPFKRKMASFVKPKKLELSDVSTPKLLKLKEEADNSDLYTTIKGEPQISESNALKDDDEDDDDDYHGSTIVNERIPPLNETSHKQLYDYFQKMRPLPRTYLEGLMSDQRKDYDLTYGIKFNPTTGKWTMGNKQIEIDGDNLTVVMDRASNRRINYSGTPGLYELIFKKKPVDYTHPDELEYADLLERTSSYRQKNDPKEQIKGTSMHKYKNIIRPLLDNIKSEAPNRRYTTGSGYDASMLVDDRTTQYVYFNDYDEIVDRLRKLYASQEAGNTSHTNEIQSIIEELREANIIY